MKIRLTESNQEWNYWKFKIHCNKLEWVNPRIRDENKNQFCVSSIFFCFKDNFKPAHWVGPSKLRPLDINHFLKITIFLMKTRLTGNTE